jgi:hypothetical protein
VSLTQCRVCTVVFVVLLLVGAAVPPVQGGEGRATSPLELEGRVLTGDGTSFVRAASVTLLVYDGPRVAQNLTFFHITVTDDTGRYNFTVPLESWDPGWNATLKAEYPLVGALREDNLTLSSELTQQRDISIPWNRTLGAGVTVAEPLLSSLRDGQVTFEVNTTNAGNDTDAVLLWAVTSDTKVVATFHPRNRTETGPGASGFVDLVVGGPDLPPGDYTVTLRWRSEWFPQESGYVDLVWRVLPDVDLSLNATGVHWWPDPLFDGDNALLNCTVHNAGRDTAVMANVSVELFHDDLGSVHRDLVRLDVPSGGSAVASSPWTAVYYETPYRLTFTVEHDLDTSPGDNSVEVALPVGVHNEAPDVSFGYPTNGSIVNGTVPVTLLVTDPDTAITGVYLSIDGGGWKVLVPGTSSVYLWDTTGVSEGWHDLRAYATDQYSSSPVVTVEVKVENLGPNHPPELYIIAPLEDDVVADELRGSGIVFDQDDYVELVEYRVDGGLWTAAVGASTWSLTMSTTGLAEGAHVLEIRAWDGVDHSAVEYCQAKGSTSVARSVMTTACGPRTSL